MSGRSAQLRIQPLRTIRDRVFLVQFILPKHLSYIGTMNLRANRHGEKVFMEAAVLLPAEAVDLNRVRSRVAYSAMEDILGP